MALSRERAVDLSRRIVERIEKEGGGFTAEKEFVRNRVVQLLVEWDRESDRLEEEAKKRVAARGRGVAPGSREWDLRFAEELERLYVELLGRGE